MVPKEIQTLKYAYLTICNVAELMSFWFFPRYFSETGRKHSHFQKVMFRCGRCGYITLVVRCKPIAILLSTWAWILFWFSARPKRWPEWRWRTQQCARRCCLQFLSTCTHWRHASQFSSQYSNHFRFEHELTFAEACQTYDTFGSQSQLWGSHQAVGPTFDQTRLCLENSRWSGMHKLILNASQIFHVNFLAI